MASAASAPDSASSSTSVHEKLSRSPGMIGMAVFGVALLAGLIYVIISLGSDRHGVHRAPRPSSCWAWRFSLALGFEFVNGFHDTANAVATVIYTHSMEPHIAVVWSGMWNFIGVLISTAGGFRDHLSAASGTDSSGEQRSWFRDGVRAADRGDPVEFGTWYLGLPASSSHTMVGSIIGVGIANQLMSPDGRHAAASIGARR